ncbi:MAG TPA: hypothetical protein PKE58_22840, partial [Acidobacteriota bacterium]|nr:hypothetical protein [Acidobacteriota bacterium]
MKRPVQAQLFRRGLDLAYWIVPHPELAWQVASQACETLDTLNQTQDYRSEKTSFLERLTNRKVKHYKMKLTSEQLYQLGVLIKAESFERHREQSDASLSVDDVTVHYVKTVVLLTLLHNPFHVAVGVSELIFDYGSSINLLKLYDLLRPADCKSKQEDHCRRAKGSLFKALKLRFDSLVTVCSGERGKHLFTRVKSTPPLVELVRQSLRHFAPWNAQCQYCHGSLKLEFLDDPGCCHILINPDCFMKLNHFNRFGSPWNRLSIPDFKLNSNQDQSPPSSPSLRETPPDWDEARINQILDDLGNQADRRKQLQPVAVSVIVDGVVQQTLYLNEFSAIRVTIPEFSRLLEIRDAETDLLLISQFLAEWSISTNPCVIRLGTGTRLELKTTLVEAGDTEEGQFEIEVRHLPAHSWPWNSWLAQLQTQGGNSFVLATSLGALCLVIVLGWYWLVQTQTPEPVAQSIPSPQTHLVPLPPDPPVIPPAIKNSQSEKDHPHNSSSSVKPPRTTKPRRPSPEDFTTRSGSSGDQDVDLASFQSVYLSVEAASFDQTIRSTVMKYLNQSPSVVLVPESDKADTRYEVTTRSSNTHLVITARLINVGGKILWTKTQTLTQPVSEEMVTTASQNLVTTFMAQVEKVR